MLFNEIYGSYFRVVSSILREAVNGQLTERRITEIVQEQAFAESTLTIPAALKSGDWPLLQGTVTPIRNVPTRPLSLLEKRWLKSLLLDPRIALFGVNADGLEDVEPLYSPDSIVYFDQYNDGDPYTDPIYQENFRTILEAIRTDHKIRVRFRGHTHIKHHPTVIPLKLEYSEKDDKFRLIAVDSRRNHIINLARIRSCQLEETFDRAAVRHPKRHSEMLTIDLVDERNALERTLLHFSHFEKETIRLDDNHYRINLTYEQEDETELLIRVLSFGPVLTVTSPERFVGLIQDRLNRQDALM